jgi:DNA-binding MarR family transcriptional regulator
MISRENILKLETRQKIYRYIHDNPGLHLREIQRKTDIPYATLKYHLKYLEKHKLISTKSKMGYRRYATSDKFSKKEREILDMFRQEIPRYILMYILFYHIFSQVEISKSLEKTPQAIAFHLKKLLKLGIIEKVPKNFDFEKDNWGVVIKRNRKNNETLYAYSNFETLCAIYHMLITCKNSLPDPKLINDVMYHYKDCTNDKSKSKQKITKPTLKSIYKTINSPDVAIETVIELTYEVFPHPYHA